MEDKKAVGGTHYQNFEIEPLEFIEKNNIPFLEGNVIKYTCRHSYKNGIEDINKAIDYLERIKKFRYLENESLNTSREVD